MSERPVLQGTVYIVDDELAIRDALLTYLQGAGYAAYAFARPQALRDCLPLDSPSVILLDVRLNGASGVEFHAQMPGHGIHAPVVFMSGQSRPQDIVNGFRQGALHFLVKPFGSAEMLEAVEEGLERDRRRHGREQRIERLRARLALLTPREREVLRLMVRGYPNRDIAAVHGTVAGTVKLQRASVLAKLQARNMAELDGLLEGTDIERLLGPA